MAINENIYGNKTSWDNNPTYEFLKMADFGTNQNTLLNGVTLGKLSPETPIDKSIAFCGAGNECPLSNVQILTNNETEAVFENAIGRTVTNWSLYTTTERFVIYGDPNRISDENSNWKDVVTDTNNINRYLKPIADFNIKNLVGVIYVRCYDAERGGGFTKTLKEYLEEYVNRYPYVSEVYLRLFGSEVDSQVGRDPLYAASGIYGGISISTLDSFPVDSNVLYRYASFKGTSSFNYLPVYGSYDFDMFGGEKWLIYGKSDLFEIEYDNDRDYLYCYIHVTNADEFKELCLKGAAQYGLYFTDNEDVARSGEFTDTNMYIGVLDENGITHGEYLKGTATAEATQNTWDSIRDSTYDYTKDIDNTNYDNSTIFYPQAATGAFTKSYVLNEAQVNALAQEAYNAVAQAPTDDSIENYNQRYFLTSNVIDCIISLKKFPCRPYIPQGPVQPIKIGAYQTNIQAYPLAYAVQQFDFIFSKSNNNTLFPVNGGDFRDYEPYTKCSISIPFCGNIEIPCAYAYRYDIKISLLVDLITGACTAFVICNGDVIETTSGNCAIDLPLSGLQSATLDSQMYSASNAKDKNKSALGLGIVGGAIAIGVGIATGGVGVALGGAAAVIGSFINANNTGKSINYEMSHMQAPFKTISAASGNISQAYDMRCKMLIKRPVIGNYDEEVYGKTIGFACLRNGKVRDFTGLTQGDIRVDDVVNNSGMSPTDTEKQMIYNTFATGVIL